MKIYTKVIIDIESLQVVGEESYEYSGPIEQCKGGGGSAGKVDYPTYMKTAHNDWIDQTGTDTITMSMVDAMNAAFSNSPFSGAAAYDPDTDIVAMLAYLADLDTYVGTISDDLVTAEVAAYSSDLTDDLDDEVYPHFEAGMRDINSVMSSAFTIGRAIIEAKRVKEVAKFSADLYLRLAIARIQAQTDLAKLGVDTYRIKAIMKSEEASANLKIEESDAKWDMEVFQYGGNLLASIAGAAHYVPNKEENTARSAVGGALSGAAAGAMIGNTIPGIGTTIGAGVGALMGIGQAFL